VYLLGVAQCSGDQFVLTAEDLIHHCGEVAGVQMLQRQWVPHPACHRLGSFWSMCAADYLRDWLVHDPSSIELGFLDGLVSTLHVK
jgi:hypothetical protein